MGSTDLVLSQRCWAPFLFIRKVGKIQSSNEVCEKLRMDSRWPAFYQIPNQSQIVLSCSTFLGVGMQVERAQRRSWSIPDPAPIAKWTDR